MTEPAQPMEDHVLVEVTVPAPADAVWAALRDPQKIRNWFGWDADSLKDEIDFIFITHASADDEKRVVTFVGVNDRYEVEARGDESIVRVVRSAPAGDWSDVFDGMIEGWISFTWQLAFAFARHEGETRRTLFFRPAPRGPAGPFAARPRSRSGGGRAVVRTAGAAHDGFRSGLVHCAPSDRRHRGRLGRWPAGRPGPAAQREEPARLDHDHPDNLRPQRNRSRRSAEPLAGLVG